MSSAATATDAAKNSDIAFIDLKAQQARIRDRVEMRLKAVLDHGRYIAGPEIEELEAILAERTGARHVIACSSGTDALVIPMLGVGLGPKDAAFIPCFTYNATANAVLVAGATPVFVDIDPDTFNMCSDDLERRIGEAKANGLNPKVVCPVDLFGLPADYGRIGAIASAHGLHLFSDGAQSFGGQQDGKWVGNLAPVTGTSFFPGKALGAYGDAGATFTNDDDMAELCQSVRWHGTDATRGPSVRVGINGRMSTFQAAVLLEKASIFWDELKDRHRIAGVYRERLSEAVKLQSVPGGTESGFGYFTIEVPDRDGVRGRMMEQGVPSAIYYKTPLHKMEAFTEFAPNGGMPNAERAAHHVLSLPMHPYLTDDQVHRVCDALMASLPGAA